MRKIISIAGTVGSGKSTICKLLSEELNYDCYLMGDMFRETGMKMGMNISEFNEYMLNNPGVDKIIDQTIIDVCSRKEELVFSSRVAWHIVPDHFKIFLYVNTSVAAKRIYEDGLRIGEEYSSIEEAVENVIKRNESEKQRYIKIYNIDVTNTENYDLALDTSNMTILEVLNTIIQKYKEYIGE